MGGALAGEGISAMGCDTGVACPGASVAMPTVGGEADARHRVAKASP